MLKPLLQAFFDLLGRAGFRRFPQTPAEPLTELVHSKLMQKVFSEKVWRILMELFAATLVNKPRQADQFEVIIKSMNEAPYLSMQHALAKCLSVLEPSKRQRIVELHVANTLEEQFGSHFYRHFAQLDYDRSLAEGRIRELFCAQLFAGISDITLPLSISNEASHHPNHMDMMFVVAIAKHIGATRIFEFGTYLGRTTCGLASISENVRVKTLNLPIERDPRYGPYIGRLIQTSPYKGRIEQIFCDSREFDPKPFSQQMDFIFIDADHSYAAVRNDTEKAFEMLAPGGVIVWHDFAPKSPGVYQYLNELSQQRDLFRIRNTCLVVYRDGLRFESFQPAPMELMLEDVG